MSKIQHIASETGLSDDAMRKARSGDRDSLPAVREWFSRCPDVVDKLAEVAMSSGYTWARVAVGDNDLLLREALEQKLCRMADEIAGKAPTPLERLLAERVAVCWLHLEYAECVTAQKTAGSTTLDALNAYEAWIDRAHKRYLSACKTLAAVRRLQIPVMQVNIGEKQVNIGQTVTTAHDMTPHGSLADDMGRGQR